MTSRLRRAAPARASRKKCFRIALLDCGRLRIGPSLTYASVTQVLDLAALAEAQALAARGSFSLTPGSTRRAAPCRSRMSPPIPRDERGSPRRSHRDGFQKVLPGYRWQAIRSHDL